MVEKKTRMVDAGHSQTQCRRNKETCQNLPKLDSRERTGVEKAHNKKNQRLKRLYGNMNEQDFLAKTTLRMSHQASDIVQQIKLNKFIFGTTGERSCNSKSKPKKDHSGAQRRAPLSLSLSLQMLCALSGETNGGEYQQREPIALKPEGFLSDSIDSMCASHVYKRRKLRNSVALLSDDIGIGGTKANSASDSSLNSECVSLERQNDYVGRIPEIPLTESISVQPHLQKPDDVLASQTDGTRDLLPLSEYVAEKQHSVEFPVNDIQKMTLECNTVNDSYSSSKSNTDQGSSSTKVETDGAGECSSSDNLLTELSVPHSSAEALCISAHGNCGQPGEVPPSSGCTSMDILGGNDAGFLIPCKVCGLNDIALKMLICDLCDEAFHLSCCKAKKLPVDEWYCRPCLRKKPKVLPETLSGQLFYITNVKQKKRMLRESLGPILSILHDTSPYSSGVRIGNDYQVEVPEWTGPIPDGNDYFGEPSELDPAEWDSLNGWNFNKSSRPNSIGNWLQCREMIYNERDENDEGVVCGKWRRAPLFMSQTEGWDCSCAVLWDPIHADCAVPQELETNEVLKQLKYVDLLKPRLTNTKGNLR